MSYKHYHNAIDYLHVIKKQHLPRMSSLYFLAYDPFFQKCPYLFISRPYNIYISVCVHEIIILCDICVKCNIEMVLCRIFRRRYNGVHLLIHPFDIFLTDIFLKLKLAYSMSSFYEKVWDLKKVKQKIK